MPLQSLHTARDRTTAERIAAARRIQLDELYAAYDQAGIKPMDLELVEQRAVHATEAGCGGRAVTVTLHALDGGTVEERLTILLSRKREDRVAAATYTVRLPGLLEHEVAVRANSGLYRLAVHVAAHA